MAEQDQCPDAGSNPAASTSCHITQVVDEMTTETGLATLLQTLFLVVPCVIAARFQMPGLYYVAGLFVLVALLTAPVPSPGRRVARWVLGL